MTGKTGNNTYTGLEIAVIGMAGRFPGARDIHEFWSNLIRGIESLSFYSDEELEEKGVDRDLFENPGYVKAGGGVLEDKESFDASFFDYTPIEAEIMDPQIRIFHECAWAALDDAGYNSDVEKESIGLFAGASSNFYWEGLTFLSGKAFDLSYFSGMILIDKDFLTTRVSYKLNLQGPSSALHTACSTSLVAVHMACRALLTGECKLALAGGVSVTHEESKGYLFQEGFIPSPDGHCRAFADNARGTIGGNGVGVVVLKRLKEAGAAGDHIYAVIRGTAVNNDGIRRIGYTAPSVKGQMEVIRAALRFSRVEPESITYIESHGTGTPLGDSVEFEALTLAFNTIKKKFCCIGSVKTNIGHLGIASGIAGFIKTVLTLIHKQIPPTLHYEKPNPRIDFENSPFYINTETRPWEAENWPLRAGVSSFGIGGTNAHVIIEEAPARELPAPSRQYQLILLSAKSESALEQMSKNLTDYFEKNLPVPGTPSSCDNFTNPFNDDLQIANAAYTLKVGRGNFQFRQKLICSNLQDAAAVLSTPGSRKVQRFCPGTKSKRLVFMFPGIGAQYVNMGWELYRKESAFRQEMDRCFEILKPWGYDIKSILYPGIMASPSPASSYSHAASSNQGNELITNAEKINRFEIAQLVIFTFEYALTQLLLKWGLKPDAMIGYSFGEYAAACISGVLSLEDALLLVVNRGESMREIPAGGMIGVPLDKEKIQPFLTEQLSLAIDIGPSCIVSGPAQAIARLETQLKEKHLLGIRVNTTKALHSPMMNAAAEAFLKKVHEVLLQKPAIPYISNVTGRWMTEADARDPGYWKNHLTRTVRFDEGMKELVKEENSIFIEVGPARDLCSMAERYITNSSAQQAINLVRPKQSDISDLYYLLNQVGNLWLYGANLDWTGFYSEEKRQRIPLPSYPFAKQPFWIRGDFLKDGIKSTEGKATIKKNTDGAGWFYTLSWKRSLIACPQVEKRNDPAVWLVFVGENTLGTHLVKQLKQRGEPVVVVGIGPGFSCINSHEYIIDPQNKKDYEALLRELKQAGRNPNRVIHLWGISKNMTITGIPGIPGMAREHEVTPGPAPGYSAAFESFARDFELGFYSLLYFTQALAGAGMNREMQIAVVTNDMQEVTGLETLCLGKSTVLGPVKAIPREHPFILCRSIDITLTEPGGLHWQELIRQLLEEFCGAPAETIIAYRGAYRWVQTVEPLPLPQPGTLENRTVDLQGILKEQGLYLIAGELGKIGLALAESLVRSVKARLVLTGHSSFPPREEWESWLANHEEEDNSSGKIKKFLELEALGGEIMLACVDASDYPQMHETILRSEEKWGPLKGILHLDDTVRGATVLHSKEYLKDRIDRVLAFEKIAREEGIDFFCWLISPISPGPADLEYAANSAVNSFMDALVIRNSRHYPGKFLNKIRWLSINWDNMEPGQIHRAFQQILKSEKVNKVLINTGGSLPQGIEHRVKVESVREDNSQVEKKAVSYARPNLSNPYEPPTHSTEQKIVHLWEEIFGVAPIGIRDDFFELGGDSLKAIMAIARIHSELSIEIPIGEFFDRPTIKQLGEYIAGAKVSAYSSINPVEKRSYYDASQAQKRIWIQELLEKEQVAFNIPGVYEFEKLNREAFEKTIAAVVERHEALRTTFITLNDEPKQIIHEPGFTAASINYRDLRDRETRAEILQQLIDDEKMTPFNLETGPLLRMKLLQLEEERWVFLFTLHHIIADGWSMGVMIREVSILYDSFIKGSDDSFPPLRIQYKDYTPWHNNQLSGENLQKHLTYWLNRLKGPLPVLDLPLDYPRPKIKTFAGEFLQFSFTGEVTEQLKRIFRQENCTLFMVFTAVVNVLLYRYTGQRDIVIGTIIAGRESRELENQIGFYLNMLALRNRLTPGQTFAELLQVVRRNTLADFEHQVYPFNWLAQELTPVRDFSRNPLFDVVILADTAISPLVHSRDGNLDNNSPVSIERGEASSKFDIRFRFTDMGSQVMANIQYNPDLFKEQTIMIIRERLLNLVSAIITDRNEKIDNLEFLTYKKEKNMENDKFQGIFMMKQDIETVVQYNLVEEFWLRKLHDIVSNPLFSDNKSSGDTLGKGVTSSCIQFPDPCSEKVHTLTGGEAAKTFLIFFTAFNILAYKYTGHRDILVSTPGIREEEEDGETCDVLLFFRTYMENGINSRILLNTALKELNEVYKYRHFDYESLLLRFHGQSLANSSALFTLGFQYTGFNRESRWLDSVQLVFRIEPRNTGYVLIVKYDTAYYQQEQVEQLGRHFINILAAMLENLEKQVNEIDIYTPQEREKMLREFSGEKVYYTPGEKIFTPCFRDQAAKNPYNSAISCDQRVLSYRELDKASGGLARWMKEEVALGPEDLVALVMERSEKMVQTIIATWKLGAAYVPIDPDFPAERIKTIAVDSRVKLLIYESGLLAHGLSAELKALAHVAVLDRIEAALEHKDSEDSLDSAEKSSHPLPAVANPGALAYVIYTSGTTGKPKGAMVEHRGMMNHLFAKLEEIEITSASVVAQNASQCFDISVWQFFAAFLKGGRTEVFTDRWVLNPAKFIEQVDRCGVTILEVVPSYLAMMLDIMVERNLESIFQHLNYLLVTGEAVRPSLVKRWFDRYPGIRMVNAYGPTEASDDITHFKMERNPGLESIPIGRTVRNFRIYIAANHMRMCPLGVKGEICVAGIGVGRGYLNHPQLTAEKFVQEGHERIYLTGDMGRWLADGNIEFLGRKDYQVKVRGYRIEMEEIENKLSTLGGINDAVVLDKEDNANNKYLCAYVTLRSGIEKKSDEIKRELRALVPEYMIPAHIVVLEALPLTPNGKVDRKALPEPGTTDISGVKYVRPRNSTEKKLVEIWQKVLGIEKIGIRDSFFNLGGDSFKGIRVVNKIQDWLQEVVHVTILFLAPTIEELAVKLESYKVVKHARVDDAAIEKMRRIIPPLAPLPEQLKAKEKNPPAIFILCPPRSGSTLLRVILTGHPKLFAPQEFELMTFNTMQERTEGLSGKFSFYLEGVIRAIMEIKGIDADESKALVAEYEEQGLTTQAFYRVLQEWLGEKTLIEKTPAYSLDLEILKRVEEYFESPLYIHLVRNPYAVIHSFENAKLDQLFKYDHDFPPRELAELVWLISHENILAFLAGIPACRQHRVNYEEMVSEPERVVSGICRFLGVEYYPGMIRVYENPQQRMTDGIYTESKMLGDVRFFTHSSIDTGSVEKWKEKYKARFLGEAAARMAKAFGYLKEEEQAGYSWLKSVEKAEYYPLSSAQKRLYFLQQLDLNSTGYNKPLVIPLGKDIDLTHLESTLQKMIRRHESFRTSFIPVKELPVQRIHSPGEIRFSMDYFEVAESEAGEIVRNFIRPFDLNAAPLARTGVIALPGNRYLWLVDIHHIIADGTSQTIITEDFLALYNGPDLPALRLQYKDFSQWQNQAMAGGKMKKQEQYWHSLYADAGEIPRLNLPVDFKRPAVFTFTGARCNFVLPGEEVTHLKELSTRLGITLYMNILALLNTLFYKYTGQTDIIIGSGIAGRLHVALHRIVGMFVNALAMRNQPEGEKPFEAFLKEVAANSIAAYENQDVQFEELVDQLNVERDPSRNPLFDISMVVQNFRKVGEGIPKRDGHLQVEEVPFVDENSDQPVIRYENLTSKFDMTFFVNEGNNREISISIEYYTAIFKEETIRQMVNHFKNIIRTVNHKPTVKLKEIEIISAAEKKQVLYEFNETGRNIPGNKTLYELYADQVEKSPDHISLVTTQGSREIPRSDFIAITYRELKRQTHQLAGYLYYEKHIRPDEPVGILVSQPITQAMGILGILEAGAAYVPLDPTQPGERLKYMLNDTYARVVISEKRYLRVLNRLQWECKGFTTYLCMDSVDIERESREECSELMDTELWDQVGETATDEITGRSWLGSYTGRPFSRAEMDEYGENTLKKLEPLLQPHNKITAGVGREVWRKQKYQEDRRWLLAFGEEKLPVPAAPHHVAYIIYTSGTTGKPKGVEVEHRSAANTICCRKAQYAMSSQDAAIQLFSYVFDGYIAGFFTPLISGARVVLMPGENQGDVDKIKETIVKNWVTHFISVPPLYHALLHAMTGEELSTLKAVTLAGDRISVELLEKSREKCPGLEIINEYGVTEAAVMSTIYRRQDRARAIKIGRPTWNTCIYILNEGEQLQPPGIPGELCIAGVGLARGYMNNPGLTAEKFTEISFYISNRSNRFYKTYSKLYKTGDLARWHSDGNIEFLGRLDQQFKIRGYRIEPGEIEARLLAHPSIREVVVIEQGEGDRYLSAYIVMGRTSGSYGFNSAELKDYLARTLPAYMIPLHFIRLEQIPLTPSGKVDRKALAAPEDVLVKVYIPPRDIVERELVEIWSEVLDINKDKISIPSNFFELGGHSLKAAILTSKIHKELKVKLPLVEVFKRPTIQEMAEFVRGAAKAVFTSIEPLEKREYYPLSSAQERFYILQQIAPDSIAYNMPIFVFLEGLFHKEIFEAALKKLINRHDSLRTSIELIEGNAVQRVYKNPTFHIEYFETSPSESKEIAAGFVKPFDLGKVPLMRSGIIELGKEEYLVMIDMHHIISDGTSTALLKRDLMEFYKGNESLLPLKLQYKDFCYWQKDLLTSGKIKKQEEFWLKQFPGQVPVLNFPTDFPRPSSQSFEGDNIHLRLETELTGKLNAMKEKTGTTLFMIMTALFSILLSKFSRQKDIIIGSAIAGRSHADLENVIGLLIETIVIRTFPGDNKRFDEFLAEVKDTALSVFENQQFPFGELLKLVAYPEDISRNPLFDAMLIVQNLTVPGEVASTEAAETGEAGREELKAQGYNRENARKGAKVDLTLTAFEDNDHITLDLQYCTKLYKRETAGVFINYLREMISTIVENKEIKLHDIMISHDLVAAASDVYNESVNIIDF